MVLGLLSELIQLPAYWRRQRKSDLPPPQYHRLETGSHPRQYVLYFPPHAGNPIRKKAILYIHGGGWQFGRPEWFRMQAAAFHAWGYPTYFLSHRKIPLSRYPEIREDLILALQAVNQHIRAVRLPVERLVAGGMSSGGNLASLLTFWEKNKQVVDSFPISGLFALGAPLDLSVMPWVPSVLAFAGRPSGTYFSQANPVEQLPATPPDTLILHGKKDGMVPLASALSFAQALKESGAHVHFPELPKMSHMDVAAWSQPSSPLREVMRNWLKSHG